MADTTWVPCSHEELEQSIVEEVSLKTDRDYGNRVFIRARNQRQQSVLYMCGSLRDHDHAHTTGVISLTTGFLVKLAGRPVVAAEETTSYVYEDKRHYFIQFNLADSPAQDVDYIRIGLIELMEFDPTKTDKSIGEIDGMQAYGAGFYRAETGNE